MSESEKIAWLAGFYEGEGTIYAQKSQYILASGNLKTNCTLRITICQNYPEPLELAESIFPPLRLKGPYKNKTSKNLHYQSYCSNDYALELIEKIYPYLSARRKEQIDSAKKEYFELRAKDSRKQKSKTKIKGIN